jgi:hypothetical protein
MKRTKEVELHNTQDITAGTLTFVSDASEEFSVCFTSACQAVNFGEVEILIDIRTGIDANDYSNLAKREHLDGLEVELKKLGDYTSRFLSSPPFPFAATNAHFSLTA